MRHQAGDAWSRSLITVPTDNFTVATLYRPGALQTASTNAWLLSHGTPASSDGWSVGFAIGSTGYIVGMVWVSHNNGILDDQTIPLKSGLWYVAVWLRNAGTWQYYLNGVARNLNNGTTAPGAATGTTYVNRTATGTGSTAQGDLAYLYQWNYVLTPSQIGFLGSLGDPAQLPNPQVGWRFDGAIPVDVGPNRYTLAVSTGAPSVGDKFSSYGLAYGAVEIAPTIPGNIDSATVLVDIQVSATEVVAVTETGTVYVDIQVTGVDGAQYVDAATLLVDIQISSCEWYTPVLASTYIWSEYAKWSQGTKQKWQVTSAYGRWDYNAEVVTRTTIEICV